MTHDLKTLRDKLNGSLPLDHGESLEQLQAQWDQLHKEMDAFKAEDERNWVECKDLRGEHE